MPTVRVRIKNQIKLPLAIVREAGLHEGDVLDAEYVEGVIHLVPRPKSREEDLMSFAGIAKGVYGRSAGEIDRNIAELSEERER